MLGLSFLDTTGYNSETYGASAARLVVQDYGEKAAIHRQPAVAAVIDKAELPELIHEMTDP